MKQKFTVSKTLPLASYPAMMQIGEVVLETVLLLGFLYLDLPSLLQPGAVTMNG